MDQNSKLILRDKDKLYKQLYELFPLNFYKKFQKWILIYGLVISLLIIVYIIVAVYLNNVIVWIFILIPIFLFLIGILFLVQINITICIKKFKINFYQNQKNLLKNSETILIINQKKIFSKQNANFVFGLIDIVYDQIKNK